MADKISDERMPCGHTYAQWADTVQVSLAAAVAAAESRGRAAGYAEAVQALKDLDRYRAFVHSLSRDDWAALTSGGPEYGPLLATAYLESLAAPSATTEEPTP